MFRDVAKVSCGPIVVFGLQGMGVVQTFLVVVGEVSIDEFLSGKRGEDTRPAIKKVHVLALRFEGTQ